MFKKVGLWRGLLFVFAILLSIAIAASVILEMFRTSIDSVTGSLSEKIVSTDDGTLYTSFTPPDDVMTDGKGDSEKLIGKFVEFGRRQGSGGTVLLKNNGALPLAGGANITLLGIRSHMPILGAGMGVTSNGPVIDLEEALSGTKTNFGGGRSEYEFADVGGDGPKYKLNPKMISAYDALLNDTNFYTTSGESYKAKPTHNGPWGASYGAKSYVDTDDYDPNEPTIGDLTAKVADISTIGYKDAGIVVLGRPGGESTDYIPGGVRRDADGNSLTGAEEPLALTTNEKAIVDYAKANCDKVIVLINTTSPMEISELASDPDVDSILYIGHPGNYGCLGIADILSGKVSPSGGLYDLYATRNMSHPAMQNMGSYTYTNADQITRKGGSMSGGLSTYVVEAEDIYTGYRYFETRYNDIVENRRGADSSTGAVASKGNWTYSEEVVYSFGYGLSYADMTQEFVGDPVITHTAHQFTMDFKVRVTNKATSTIASKANVQIYGQAPYKVNGLEKSAIQLLAYDKTDEAVAPGDEAVLDIRVDLQNLATYDMSHKNDDGTYGTYILDEGDYYFALGNGSHDALNNVLAAQGRTVANTSGKMDADGVAAKAYKFKYDYAGGDVDDTTFAVTKNNEKVSNHLEYSDWNHFENGKVKYLSRNDWSGTYPNGTDYDALAAPASMLDYLNGKYYEVKTTDDTSDITFGQAGDMTLSDMKLAKFDDYRWNELLSQMTVEESMGLVGFGGPDFRKISSINFGGGSYTENAGNGISLKLKGTKSPDAPWTIDENDKNGDYHCGVFACAPLVASAFDPDLQNELGEIVGLQALFVGLPILWGPGLNTHRHPYNGRNGEYYSEDPILCGNSAMEFAIGALKYGLIAAPKHFAFNDQETNRAGIAPFMTEQRAREIELRAFQIAFEASKYDTAENNAGMIGLMTSFSKIGPVECTASYGLMTSILQKEWGFHGYAVTDIWDDTDLFTAIIYSGTTCFDMRMGFSESGFDSFQSMADGVKPSPELYAKDATILNALKNANHNVLWALCQSNLMNVYNSSSHVEWQMTWYRGLYIALIVVFSVLAAGAAAMYVLSQLKAKKEEKE